MFRSYDRGSKNHFEYRHLVDLRIAIALGNSLNGFSDATLLDSGHRNTRCGWYTKFMTLT